MTTLEGPSRGHQRGFGPRPHQRPVLAGAHRLMPFAYYRRMRLYIMLGGREALLGREQVGFAMIRRRGVLDDFQKRTARGMAEDTWPVISARQTTMILGSLTHDSVSGARASSASVVGGAGVRGDICISRGAKTVS